VVLNDHLGHRANPFHRPPTAFMAGR